MNAKTPTTPAAHATAPLLQTSVTETFTAISTDDAARIAAEQARAAAVMAELKVEG